MRQKRIQTQRKANSSHPITKKQSIKENALHYTDRRGCSQYRNLEETAPPHEYMNAVITYIKLLLELSKESTLPPKPTIQQKKTNMVLQNEYQ